MSKIKYKNINSGLEGVCTEKEFEQMLLVIPGVFIPLEQLAETPPEATKISDTKKVA
jgi:hypothetical protein